MSSQDWYIIDPQPTLNNGLENEEWNDWISDSFDEALTETPLGKEIYLCKGQYDGEQFEVEVKTEGIVQSETPDAYTQGWQRQLLTRISDSVQDYKYIRYDGNIWVIMTIPSDNTIYNKCVIHLCNYTLKWQDKKTGNIYYYPCNCQDATQYNTGVENQRDVLSVGYIQLMCWLSLDEISVSVERNTRMFIDTNKVNPTVYTVTSKSTVPYSYGADERVLRITFTEDLYNPDTDSIEQWICNYVDPHDIPQPTEPINIEYAGEPTLRIGMKKTFTSSMDNVVFSLVVSEMWQDKITLTQNGNSAVVKCENNPAMVGSNFKIKVAGNGQRSELLVAVIGAV